MTLYVSDLDGTLLTSNGRLSNHSRSHLNELIGAGCRFTVASARSVKSMQIVLDGLELELPVVEFNGACISDLSSGKHLHTNSLTWEAADSVLDAAAQEGIEPFYSTIERGEDFLFPAEIGNPGMNWYLQDRIENNDLRLQSAPWSDKQRVTHELICLTFIDSEPRLKDLKRALDGKEILRTQTVSHLFDNLYSPGWYWLTVHNIRAQKHIAVQQLQEHYAGETDRLVVFGDNLNDLSLFATADRGYAVSNAADPVLKSATEVIGSNDDDAVVKKILAEL